MHTDPLRLVILSEAKNQLCGLSVRGHLFRVHIDIEVRRLILRFAQNDTSQLGA